MQLKLQNNNTSQKLSKNYLTLPLAQQPIGLSWNVFQRVKRFPVSSLFSEMRFITDFRKKAELFNFFFANQCSLISSSSALPTDYELFTDKSLSNITFTDDDIGKTISSLDRSKAHDHDMMSIRILKIRGDSIYRSIGLIFRTCLEHRVFPQNWKKANVKKRQAINKEL